MKASKKQIEILKRIVKEAEPTWKINALYATQYGLGYFKVMIIMSKSPTKFPEIINLTYHKFQLEFAGSRTEISLSFLNKIASIDELRGIDELRDIE